MTGPVFVDTNVWLYARDTSDARKHAVAREWIGRLWEDACGRTSLQVLSEYYVNVTKRLSKPLAAEEAWEDVTAMLAWSPQPIDDAVLQRAREIERRYQLGWWDSLVVAAAQIQNCSTLLTEDLQDGQTMSGLRIRNPFVPKVSDDAWPARISRKSSRPSRMSP
jgi:predicted nucleic acid-binding protein